MFESVCESCAKVSYSACKKAAQTLPCPHCQRPCRATHGTSDGNPCRTIPDTHQQKSCFQQGSARLNEGYVYKSFLTVILLFASMEKVGVADGEYNTRKVWLCDQAASTVLQILPLAKDRNTGAKSSLLVYDPSAEDEIIDFLNRLSPQAEDVHIRRRRIPRDRGGLGNTSPYLRNPCISLLAQVESFGIWKILVTSNDKCQAVWSFFVKISEEEVVL